MTRDDYDERRKRMDEELRAGIELLQAAHAAQVRALDLVWMSSEPTRGSLVRVLQELLAEKLFAVEARGILGSGGMVLNLRGPNPVLSHAIRGLRHSNRGSSHSFRGSSSSIRGLSHSNRD